MTLEISFKKEAKYVLPGALIGFFLGTTIAGENLQFLIYKFGELGGFIAWVLIAFMSVVIGSLLLPLIVKYIGIEKDG